MRTLLTVFSLLFSSLSMSQELDDTLKTYYQSPVVVSASRMEQRLHEVARSASVISSAHLGMSLHTSLADALEQENGLYIVGAGQNYGMLQSFFVRGAANNQTAVLIDGVRLTDPSTVNNAIDGSELSLTGVERIEIVRGSHSTFFGSSAIGGVVNIISQSPTDVGFAANASVTGGLFGSGTSFLDQEVNITALDGSGLFAITNFKRQKSEGLDATVDTVTNPAIFKKRDRDGFQKTDMATKFGYRSATWEVFGAYRQGTQKADLDREAFVDDDNYTLSFRRQLLTYGSSLEFSRGFKLKAVGGYSVMNRDAENDSSIVSINGDTDHLVTEDRYKGSTATHELQCEFAVDNVFGIFGLGSYRETMSSRNRLFYSGYEKTDDTDTLKPTSETLSLFANVIISGGNIAPFLNPISLGMGVRTVKNNLFGSSTTFDVNPSMRVFEGGVIYAAYSKGFNAPSLYQLFSPEPHYLSMITRGNKGLKAEESQSFEVGAKFDNDFVSVTVSGFHVEIDNVIEFVYLWDKSIGLDTLGNDWLRDDNRGNTYLNLGKQISRGIEFSVEATLLKNLWASAGFSLIGGTLSYSPVSLDVAKTEGHHVQLYSNGAFLNNDVEVETLVRRPNTAHVTVRCEPYEEWLLLLSIRSVGKRYDVFYDSQLGPYGALGAREVDAYVLVDLSQRLELMKNLVVRAKIENVFDTRYSEIRGFTTRGRGVYFGMQYTIY